MDSFITKNGNVPNSSLADKFAGCILGGATGDALGSPTEGRTPDEIRERFGARVEDFVQPYAAKPDGRHKGDGYITDDTLMILALCRAYLAKGGQMDAYDMATYLVPEIADKPAWVPELAQEMLLLNRIFYPEKYLFLRLRLASANPREGGLGNMVNCGAAMYAAPVGMMNAGDPDVAYERAINLFTAHTYSYGLEAAAIMAACIAEALRPSSTVDSVIEVARRLSKDGTHSAIVAVTDAAWTAPDNEAALQRHLRAAMEPFDTMKGGVQEFTRGGGFPSRLHSIEELPLALGYLVTSGGNYFDAVSGAVNYGRDSDSIAGMVGAIIGAMVGKSKLPTNWVQEISQRNKIDFEKVAADMLTLFTADYQVRRTRQAQRDAELMDMLLEGSRKDQP